MTVEGRCLCQVKKTKNRTSSRSGVGEEEVYVGGGKEKGDEEGSDDDFFNAAEGTAMTSRSLFTLQPKADKVRAIQKKNLLGPWHQVPILRCATSSAPSDGNVNK